MIATAVVGCSSDDAGPTTTFHALARGDVARVLAANAVPPAGWEQRGFDDGAWPIARLFVGNGSRADTVVDGLCSAILTLYARAPLDVGPLAPAVTQVRTTAPAIGGGYKAWINGVLVATGAGASSGDQLTLAVPLGTLRPRGNVLAVEAHCRADGGSLRIGPTLDVVPPAGGTAGIVRGPYLQAPTSTGATVVFETATPLRGRVVVDARTFDGPVATHHVIAVTGLAAGGAYAYHAQAGELRSEDSTLATLPAPAEPVTFAVYGDTRTRGDDARRVALAIAGEAVDLVVNTGDLVGSGADADEWTAFFTIAYPLLASTPLLPAVGNHEVRDDEDDARAFRAVFVTPVMAGSPAPGRVYAIDAGGAHLAVLDSNLELAAQATWLDADLTTARAAGARHLFVVLHHGPYSAGRHGGSEDARALLVPVAQRHGVAAFFAGHDHIYERGEAEGVRYFVTGGGGAPLYDATPLDTSVVTASRLHYLLVHLAGDTVRVEAKDIDGVVFDSAEW